MVELVIMRHGQSLANQQHLFTGWSDVALTATGLTQAHEAGSRIAATGLTFQQVHTSMLKRAIMTANIVLDEIGQNDLPMIKTWRLNERHYGALRGQNKDVVKQRVGAAQLHEWRRSFTTVPPLLAKPDVARRYAQIGVTEPRGESLKMAYDRLMPYWQDHIAPGLRAGHNQLVVAHGSTLRAMIKYLERISDDAIDQVEVPNGKPIWYQIDSDFEIVAKRVLD